MKIIIAGAGEVGRHLAKMLSNENQDIILLDESQEKMVDLDATCDLMIKVGSPTSIVSLEEAGIATTDLFIAVTPDESVNMTACMLANNLGAKKTVARVNNYEYLLDQHRSFFKQLGVNSLIYPEMLAANGIVESLQRGWLREYRCFGNEALILACIKVRSNSMLLNKHFSTGYFQHDRYRIVAIKRHGQTIIPRGNDEVQANDLVYFICNKENLDAIRIEGGKEMYDIKRVIFMGGGRIAVKTIQVLPKHISVKVIEQDREKAIKLTEYFGDRILVINGDARNLELLKEENIANTDAFIATTSNTEANILACLGAKSLGIRKSIAEVENIDYIDMADNLDIGTIINKKLIAASHIYELTLDEDAANVQCLTYSDAQVVEFIVKPGDKITKALVRDLRLPDNVNIGGVVRDGKGYIVTGNFAIQPGDHVVLFCMAASLRKLAKFFNN